MKNRVSQPAPVRLISFSLAALTVLGVMCSLQFSQSRKSSRFAREMCLRAAIQLCEYSEMLSQALLNTCAAADSERLSRLACAAASASAAAKSQLTVLGKQAHGLYGFFAAAESFSASCGSSLTADERLLALELSDRADCLHTAMSSAAQRAMSTDMTADEIARAVALAAASADLGNCAVSTRVTAARTPAVLSLPEVTSQSAARAASNFCPVPEILWREVGNDGGEIPLYSFSYSDVSISITKNGGLIYSFVKSAPCGAAQISSQSACDKARQLLQKIGCGNMVCLRQRLDGSRVDFEFVPSQQGVLCCDETVKVGVCLATGDILRLDASGYLVNGSEHNLSVFPRDLSFVDSLVPEGLTLTKKELALIEGEVLCVRAECTVGSHAAILYYDVNSLSEKRIEFLPSGDVYNRTSGQ